MSILVKTKNLFPVILKSIKSVFIGKNPFVDPEVAIKRIKKCEDCENLLGSIRRKYICRICECKIQYKARLKSSSCPINKWNDVYSI
tara:strand:- start:359 stop:619 length:261 start_codon:yes stop_codon:yes gene_type:complete